MTPRKVYEDAENYKKFSSKMFDFRKVLKIHEIEIVNPRISFCIAYTWIEKQLKFEILDGREALFNLA